MSKEDTNKTTTVGAWFVELLDFPVAGGPFRAVEDADGFRVEVHREKDAQSIKKYHDMLTNPPASEPVCRCTMVRRPDVAIYAPDGNLTVSVISRLLKTVTAMVSKQVKPIAANQSKIKS